MSAMNIVDRIRGGFVNNEFQMQSLHKQLLRAIPGEYRKFGRCDYIEYLLEKGGNVSMIEESVLNLLGGCGWLWDEPNVFLAYNQYIPVIHGERVFWTFGGVRSKAGDRDILAAVNAVKTCGEACCREKTAGNTPETDKEGRKNPFYQKTDVQAEAEKKAEKICADARAEREKILHEARAEAEKICASARAEADDYMTAMKKKAMADAAETRQKAEDKAAAEGNALVERYLKNYQNTVQTQLAEQMAESCADEEKVFDALRQQRTEMCNITDAHKRNMNEVIDDFLNAVKRLNNDFDCRARDWQQSLFRYDLRPIAECYVQLYRIVTQNPFLTGAVMEACENESESYTESTLKNLELLKASLTAYLKIFEKAMLRIGLHVYRPSAGEEYDDYWHAAAGGIDSGVVADCEVPGVMCCPDGDIEDGTPVMRAVVTLKGDNE